MRGKIVVPILIIILLAFLCADYVYERYRKSYTPEGNVYFLQQGVYMDSNSIQNIAASYITVEQNHKFYTYLGMTTDKENALKVQALYEKKNIPIYVKMENIENPEFLSELSQYDILLKNATSEEEIGNILETILSTYEEIVISE